MHRCTKCIMPDTKPGVVFDLDGVCNACNYFEDYKNWSWDYRRLELDSIAQEAIAQQHAMYDCVVPVSGGKDSMFIMHTARGLGLRPLGVYVKPLRITPRGERNFRNLSGMFETITFTIPEDWVAMSYALENSFTEHGKPLQPYDNFLYGKPVELAQSMSIPLVIWGENPEEMYGNNPEPFQQYDTSVKVIYLSDYIYWDSRTNAEFAQEYGLEIRPDSEVMGTGGYWPFEQLDDEFPIVSHYIKYLKYGYGRATDQACRDIRCGHIGRDEALVYADLYDGQINPLYIANYCDYINISIAKFMDVCRRMTWMGK